MTMSALAALIILITLPLSYGFVKVISLVYEVRADDIKHFSLSLKQMNKRSPHFE